MQKTSSGARFLFSKSGFYNVFQSQFPDFFFGTIKQSGTIGFYSNKYLPNTIKLKYQSIGLC